jgi:hypothetical protein
MQLKVLGSHIKLLGHLHSLMELVDLETPFILELVQSSHTGPVAETIGIALVSLHTQLVPTHFIALIKQLQAVSDFSFLPLA